MHRAKRRVRAPGLRATRGKRWHHGVSAKPHICRLALASESGSPAAGNRGNASRTRPPHRVTLRREKAGRAQPACRVIDPPHVQAARCRGHHGREVPVLNTAKGSAGVLLTVQRGLSVGPAPPAAERRFGVRSACDRPIVEAGSRPRAMRGRPTRAHPVAARVEGRRNETWKRHYVYSRITPPRGSSSDE